MVAVPETQSELDKWGVQPEARLVLAHGDDDDGDGDDGDDCDTDGDDGDNANASKLVRGSVCGSPRGFLRLCLS